MRELTKKEKKLCIALLDKDKQEQHQLRVGDVLYGLYGFECIEKDSLGAKYPDSPFKIRLTCLSAKRQEIVDDLNEAISLLLMLKNKDMISFVDSKSDKCFGDNTPKMYGLHEPEHSDAAVIDLFDVNTWQLLNSYYYVSNSFKDYCKDYKTIEQRRHEKEVKLMKCTNKIALVTALLAFITLIITIMCSCGQSQPKQTIENTQAKTLINIPEDIHKKSPKKLMADSVVSLSFQGFTLGKPLSGALKKAKENNRVWNVKREGNETKGETSVMLLAPHGSLTVSFTINTYHDTIYRIVYKSTSDKAFGNIADLYKEKYGSNCKCHFESPDATYNPNNNKFYNWSFSNQRIEVSELDFVMTIRDYMMKDKEYLKLCIDNRDHSVYVHYTDFTYQHKAHIVDSIRQVNEIIIKERKQHIQDSINKIKAEKRNKVSIEQI